MRLKKERAAKTRFCLGTEELVFGQHYADASDVVGSVLNIVANTGSCAVN